VSGLDLAADVSANTPSPAVEVMHGLTTVCTISIGPWKLVTYVEIDDGSK
jgi:hypothetical protein